MFGDAGRWEHSHVNAGHLRRRLLLGASLVVVMLLAMASQASALTIGVNWRGYGTGDLDAVQTSGATVYRMAFDYSGTSGGNWSSTDQVVEAAWRRGITILPILVRSGGSGNRFLLESDPGWASWGAWAQEAVERYGVNGSFWTGKANPTPIQAWEVWNEPNLAENNPIISKASCEALKQPFNATANTCIQPQNYGKFLRYTSEKLQAGSYVKTAHGTEVIFGGLYGAAGESVNNFLSKAYAISGVPASFTGLGLHPYSFVTLATGFVEQVNGAHNELVALGAGSKGLWITEFGWPVAGTEGFPPGGHSVTETEQSELLTASFNWMKASASADNIAFAAWFNIHDYSTGNHWDGYCGLLRADGSYRPSWYAFQAQTGVEGTGTQYTAFQSNAHELWFYLSTTLYGYNTAEGMDAESSPSAVSMPRGGDMIAFQDWHHELWLYSTLTGVAESTHLGMQPGTSPSIAYVPGTGYLVAFQDWHHELWTYSTTTGVGFNSTLGMEEHSSPSLAVKPDGSYAIGFQANNHELWYYPSSTGLGVATSLGMQPATSPGIASIPSGGYRLAFQDWHHELWTYSTVTGTGFDTTLGMEEHAGPSVAVKPDGSYAIGFQANNHELWYYPSSTGIGVPTTLGMDPGSSPSIGVVPSASWLISFQDWHHELWNYSASSGTYGTTTLGMTAGTSPSLTVH
jgi:hypothetical protein